jgi:hypothetical protein
MNALAIILLSFLAYAAGTALAIGFPFYILWHNILAFIRKYRGEPN